MGEVRLAQLAREFGTTKKDLMERLPDLGIHLKKSTVDIDDKLAAQIREKLSPLTAKPAAGAAPVDAKAPAKKTAKTAAEPAPTPAPGAQPTAALKAVVVEPNKHLKVPEKVPAPSVAKPAPAPPKPAPAKPAAPAPTATVPASAKPPLGPEKVVSQAPAPVKPAPLPPVALGEPARPVPSKPLPTPAAEAPSQAVLKPLMLSEAVTVKELSDKLGLKSRDIIKRLLERGTMVTINQTLDGELARDLVKEFGYDGQIATFEEVEALEQGGHDQDHERVTRPPVVTIMGHVDHGKTSLLDAIRQSNVAGGEAGQITQHIGAYQVVWKNRRITFVDTPGHEAFTMMRARGAKVTDIVILVVGADDGVMPQTVEAIHHSRAAGVPIVVAINKIDLPQARPDVVRQQLADHGLLSEAWGGDTVMVEISAKKRLHLEDLLEMILLVADMKDLKANPARAAQGVVLEAKLDRGRGPVATVLVENGTLRPGDAFIAGAVYGKVRAMFDDLGAKVEEAPPATPVEVLGLQGLPQAGDAFQVMTEDWKARQIGSFRQQQLRDKSMLKTSRLTLSHLHDRIAEGKIKELPIVLKADTQGSVEVLTGMLQKLSTEKVRVRIIHSATGAIGETDVLLASASNGIVVGFNVRPEPKARELAQKEEVDIRLHTIIYNITAELEAAMDGLLDPTYEEVSLGRAEVRQIFRIPKVGVIAGSYVTEGKITRDAQVRILRDNVVVFEGKLASLRRVKDDASEVRKDYECGIGIANYQDIKEGDVFEAFQVKRVEPTKK